MREIKFRAWHQEKRKMFYSNKDYEISFFQRTYSVIDWNGIKIFTPHFSELMQFTGLHDVDDKEIYEDDIIRFQKIGVRQNEELIERVIWKESGYWAIGSNNDWSCPLYLMKSSEWEIIGNIHENPELLDAK